MALRNPPKDIAVPLFRSLARNGFMYVPLSQRYFRVFLLEDEVFPCFIKSTFRIYVGYMFLGLF